MRGETERGRESEDKLKELGDRNLKEIGDQPGLRESKDSAFSDARPLSSRSSRS
jgi:hypothetical protein